MTKTEMFYFENSTLVLEYFICGSTDSCSYSNFYLIIRVETYLSGSCDIYA